MTDSTTGVEASAPAEDVSIVYDGECPFCQHFMLLVRVRESAGSVRLIDARSDDPLVTDVIQRGFDLDQGMIVKIGERFYHGAEAMQVLAMLSTRTGWFNKLNYQLFRSQRASRALYPLLRSGRNLVLRIRGHKPIHSQKAAKK